MPTPYLGDFPEPDRIEGAPHPRETARLFGHAEAEALFLQAHATGRLHHGWLITGPRGVGKATLAWKIARFLLAEPDADGGLFAPPPPQTLDLPPDHPVSHRMAALSEPRLYLLRRGLNESESAPAREILVKEVRALKSFFTLSAADGGRRVAIVDAADDMNPAAANALLKLLEEPPPRVTLLMVSHRPAALLPTIRSRCRTLRLGSLDAGAMALAMAQAGAAPGTSASDAHALAELAGGSVGEAIRLSAVGGDQIYRAVVDIFATLPRLDRPRALALAEAAGARGAEARFDATLRLIDLFLARLARCGATGTPPPEATAGEAAVLTRLAPDPAAGRLWADLAQTLGLRARRGRAVNLDPAALLFDMVLKIDAMAGTLAQR